MRRVTVHRASCRGRTTRAEGAAIGDDERQAGRAESRPDQLAKCRSEKEKMID